MLLQFPKQIPRFVDVCRVVSAKIASLLAYRSRDGATWNKNDEELSSLQTIFQRLTLSREDAPESVSTPKMTARQYLDQVPEESKEQARRMLKDLLSIIDRMEKISSSNSDEESATILRKESESRIDPTTIVLDAARRLVNIQRLGKLGPTFRQIPPFFSILESLAEVRKEDTRAQQEGAVGEDKRKHGCTLRNRWRDSCVVRPSWPESPVAHFPRTGLDTDPWQSWAPGPGAGFGSLRNRAPFNNWLRTAWAQEMTSQPLTPSALQFILQPHQPARTQYSDSYRSARSRRRGRT